MSHSVIKSVLVSLVKLRLDQSRSGHKPKVLQCKPYLHYLKDTKTNKLDQMNVFSSRKFTSLYKVLYKINIVVKNKLVN